MSSSLDHKCQRCGSQYHGQICPFCTITGLDVNALLAAEGLTMPQAPSSGANAVLEQEAVSNVTLVDVVSNRIFPVSNPVCRFGRDISNDIVLTGDKSLSRFHFQITFLNNEYFVEDSGSRNGTFLNGSPVTAPRKVLNGDIISAGMTRYRFVIGEDTGSNGHELSFEATPESTAKSPQVNIIDEQATTTPRPLTGLDHLLAGPPQQEPQHREEFDPLAKIFAEGQALLSSAGDHSDPMELDAFFKTSESSNGDTDAEASGFMKLEHPKETPVDELFQEQLRAISAANDTKATEEISLPRFSNPELPADSAPRNELLENTSIELEIQATPAEPQPSQPTSPEFAASTPEVPEALLRPESAITAFASEVPPMPQAPQATAPQLSTEPVWPQWCRDYKLSELEHVCTQIDDLQAQISALQTELEKLNSVVQSAEGIKNRLLAGRGHELNTAVESVLRSLAWDSTSNGNNANEIAICADGVTVAILRVVCTDAQPKPNELASLVSSLSTYWCEHGIEPKGILLVSFMTDGAPSERPTLSQDFSAYASKKNVCVMSSTQLLAIHRQVAFHGADVESIKAAILDTSGQLAGYDPDAAHE